MNQQPMNNGSAYQEPFDPKSVPQKGKGFLTAALVLGIIAICTSFFSLVNSVSLVLGVLAIVFGVVSLSKKLGTKTAIISIGLGILAIIIALVMRIIWLNAINNAVNDLIDVSEDNIREIEDNMAYMNGDKTDDILENDLVVDIGTFQIIPTDYYRDTKLEVVLKNKSDKTSSFTVKIEAIDKNGFRLDTETIYVSDLGAGQSQKFDIFKYVSSEKLEQYTQATFNVVEVTKY